MCAENDLHDSNPSHHHVGVDVASCPLVDGAPAELTFHDIPVQSYFRKELQKTDQLVALNLWESTEHGQKSPCSGRKSPELQKDGRRSSSGMRKTACLAVRAAYSRLDAYSVLVTIGQLRHRL